METQNGADIKRATQANIILYSKPGDGKTTVAGLLPGKTLVLDIDGTSQVLEGYANVDVAKIDTNDPHSSILKFYAHAKVNIANYDNIFIDNLTHYLKLWLLEKGDKTKSGMPELKDYAILYNHLLKVVETFNSLDANVVYTFWETTRDIIHEDGQQYTQFVPDIPDKIANHVMGIVHVVARLARKSDGSRGFILEGNQSIFAKNHLDARKGCLQNELLNIGAGTSKIKEDIKFFKRDAYYFHPESDSFLEFKVGQEVPTDPDFSFCNSITKEEYEKGIKEEKQKTQKGDDE